MIRVGEKVFVDTGAWVALALAQDPLNGRAKTARRELEAAGARLVVSVPVVIETFTFLQRRYAESLALTWRDRLREVERLEVIDCSVQDVEAAWAYLDRKDLHRLSLVDATSFVLMNRLRLRAAFTFDTHFAEVGFRCVG